MNSLVCIDANLVLRALVLWASWQDNGDVLIAPTLLAFEVEDALMADFQVERGQLNQIQSGMRCFVTQEMGRG